MRIRIRCRRSKLPRCVSRTTKPTKIFDRWRCPPPRPHCYFGEYYQTGTKWNYGNEVINKLDTRLTQRTQIFPVPFTMICREPSLDAALQLVARVIDLMPLHRHTSPMLRCTPAAVLSLALLPLAAAAQAQAQVDNDPYAVCAAMTESAARLGCFDTTYAGQQAGRTQQTEEQRAENFGLRSSAAAAREEEQPDGQVPAEAEFTLSAAVTEAFVDGLGKRVLLLDNGQLWRETTGSTMRGSPPAAGSQASISESWSGAYQLRIEGRRGYIRATRIR